MYTPLFTAWQHLSHLELEGISFSSHDWMPATGPTRITSLIINKCGLTDGELAWFVRFTSESLKVLRLVEYRVGLFRSAFQPSRSTEIGVVELVDSLPSLKHLTLDTKAFTPTALRKILSQVSGLRSLTMTTAVLDHHGLAGAPDSLDQLVLAQYWPPENETEEEDTQAVRATIDLLRACPLGKIKHIVIFADDYLMDEAREIRSGCPPKGVRVQLVGEHEDDPTGTHPFREVWLGAA